MKCKFKKFSNEAWCQVICGECQFIKSHYGPVCPIYNNYDLWDKYVVEWQANHNPDHIAYVENIATEDMFDDGKTTDVVVDVLDIITNE